MSAPLLLPPLTPSQSFMSGVIVLLLVIVGYCGYRSVTPEPMPRPIQVLTGQEADKPGRRVTTMTVNTATSTIAVTTLMHDEHLFVVLTRGAGASGAIIHHPGCPCTASATNTAVSVEADRP